MPSGVFPAAQSAQIHAKGLKLSNLGSLEPDNCDTFVSSPQLESLKSRIDYKWVKFFP